MGALTQPIIIIIIGLLIGWLSPRLLKGTLASIFSIAGWILTIVGVVLLVMALI